MARAIVRYSMQSGEQHSHARIRRTRATNAIRTTLRDAGFESVGTAAWQGTGDAEAILRTVECVVGIVRQEAPEMLDHVWLYVDSSG